MEEAILPEVRQPEQNRQGYAGCRMLALERIPVPFPLLAGLLCLFALGEQIIEYTSSPQPLRLQPVEAVRYGGAIVIMIAYILLYLRILKRRSLVGLERLRPAVKISDAEYEVHARRMLTASPRVETGLAIVATAVVIALFTLGDASSTVNRPNQPLPDSFPLAVLMLSAYILLGWLLLSLVYTNIRYARELRALAKKPLEVNIFDPMNLLPFGDLSLLQSLSAAGLLVIPMLLYGPPKRAGFLVIGVSVISLAALFVPLYGVHRQMDDAREHALDRIYVQLMETQRQILGEVTLTNDELAYLANHTTLLASLRELVLKSPVWPFRDVASIVRASLAVASPFLVYILQRMIDAFLSPIWMRGRP